MCVIYPYKMGSASARLLSSALGTVRVRQNGTFTNRRNLLIVNWGSSNVPHFPLTRCLNKPQNVGVAANKLRSFLSLEDGEVDIPWFSDSKEDAEALILRGGKVVCRTTLTGHSGQGIVIASAVEELVDAPLYTQFVEKGKEYRVHVFNGEVIDYQQKKKRNGGDSTGDVRNIANGWVYARSDVVLPSDVAAQSIKAVASLGLDFGAVDVCVDRAGNVFVFEVNTAPGLEGTTLQKYVEALQQYERETDA